MSTSIALCKFVGTISLGLLTGVSYTLSTLTLPSLLTLPSAKPAAYTLRQTARLANLHITALSALSTLSLGLAFALSPKRIRHPYLLWTAAIAAGSGGMSFVIGDGFGKGLGKGRGKDFGMEEMGDVNGEGVERRARELQWGEVLRMGVSGVGFVMGVVGIWGDGA
ncbi:hypothetical protein B0A54_03848 [Friedmanniomyces endolithicus]|uniref:Uncharacterized protein n=1 Tax=Friedmanniomyces endolithicus TaxID=329885 RepID=A0A4U0VE04_9PEZI|nr:hypothetical protein B0A54_03848 [Friedmanniomyces endolithicus]